MVTYLNNKSGYAYTARISGYWELPEVIKKLREPGIVDGAPYYMELFYQPDVPEVGGQYCGLINIDRTLSGAAKGVVVNYASEPILMFIVGQHSDISVSDIPGIVHNGTTSTWGFKPSLGLEPATMAEALWPGSVLRVAAHSGPQLLRTYFTAAMRNVVSQWIQKTITASVKVDAAIYKLLGTRLGGMALKGVRDDKL